MMPRRAAGGLAGLLAGAQGGSEDVSRTVKMMDGNMRSGPGRVLRAADIMPPFCNDEEPRSQADDGAKPAGKAPKTDQSTGERKLRHDQRAQGEGAGAEVPRYDLEENILAEHRRSASKRRKSPVQMQPEPAAPAAHVDMRTQVAEPPTQDPLEIRRIVAEIVARDIERLCRKPSKPVYGL
jgi:hypothetical protein